MPSRAFTSAKTKLLARKFGTTLGEKYKANEDEFAAARVGDSLVAINGQLYPGAIAGEVATVTNAGRPAAAQYVAGGGGAVVVQASASGSAASGGSTTIGTPGTLNSTSINQATNPHTHAIDMTIARAPYGSLGVNSINENTTVGHTHALDASSDPDLASKILKSNTSGQLVLRELRVRDALGGATGITHDGVGPVFQHGLRSADDDRTSYLGRATVGYVGHGDFAGFAHRARGIQTDYAVGQDSTGDNHLNAPAGRTVKHRINNTDVFLTTQNAISISSANSATIKSDNYVSQLTGWGMTYAGALDARYIFVDEMHAKAFIADLEQALAGGQIICKSVTTLASDFRAPYPGAYNTLVVDDLPSAENMQVFQANDYIRLRQFSRAGGGLDISNCWGTVSSPADLSDKQQSWRYTRSGTTTYSVIGWRTASSTVSANSTAIALSKPTGTVANDVIVASISYIASAGQTVTAAPSGWVRLWKQTHTNGTLTNEVWTKTAGGSEPASYTFTMSAACVCGGAIQAYSNCLLANSPIDQYNVQSNTSSVSMPSGTLTPISGRAGAVFVACASLNAVCAPPAGMSEQVDTGVTGLRIYLANQTAATQTALTLTGTISTASESIGGMILLMPAYTSSLDATTGMMTPGSTVGAKSIVLDYGVSGNGFYEVNAIDGIYGDNSPYAQIVTWTGHPATGQTLRSRWGNLKGVFGIANEYGMYIGNGIAATSQYLRLSSYTNEIHNLPIKMHDGSGSEFFRADTAGLTYTVPANSSLQDQISILYKTQAGNKIFQVGGHSDISDGRFGWVRMHRGTTDSQLVLMSDAPSGYYSTVTIQNSVGSNSSQWLFKNLADGTVGADFSGYLGINGDPTSRTNHYGQLHITPSNQDRDAFISIRTTRGSDRTWLVGAGSGTGVTNFRIYDYTAGADRLTISSSSVVALPFVDLGSLVPGPSVSIGGNSNATNACSGTLNIYDRGGTARYIWPDQSGNLRIHTTAPTNFATDTSGAVVGAQTSWHGLKRNIEHHKSTNDLLRAVLDVELYDYEMKGTGHKHTGIVISDADRQAGTWYGENMAADQIPTLNERNLFGYLIGAIQEQQKMIERLQEMN